MDTLTKEPVNYSKYGHFIHLCDTCRKIRPILKPRSSPGPPAHALASELLEAVAAVALVDQLWHEASAVEKDEMYLERNMVHWKLKECSCRVLSGLWRAPEPRKYGPKP
jgi:hypothetical protein